MCIQCDWWNHTGLEDEGGTLVIFLRSYWCSMDHDFGKVCPRHIGLWAGQRDSPRDKWILCHWMIGQTHSTLWKQRTELWKKFPRTVDAGSKHKVNSWTTAERGENIIDMVCFNTYSQHVSWFVIFKSARINPYFKNSVPSESYMAVSEFKWKPFPSFT
jgi:hypothetical protein